MTLFNGRLRFKCDILASIEQYLFDDNLTFVKNKHKADDKLSVCVKNEKNKAP
jgi:hypothetical protein